MPARVVSDEEDEGYEEEGEHPVDREVVEDERNPDDEEEEEDEEGQDEYEKDGFIVDDDDEEEQEDEDDGRENSDEEERHKRKRKKKRESEKNYVLDEDDYELLQDNNITGFRRPEQGSKKFKRLKKAGRDAEEEHSGFSDDQGAGRKGQGVRTAEEKLKRSLFGDDESAPLEDIAEEEEQQEEEEDVDIGEDDEMADFIVDEEDVDEDGAPMPKKKIKKKKPRQAPGVSSSALQEAHEIFGDVDELLMLRKKGLERAGADSHGWADKRIEDEFEPQIVQKNYMTSKDEIIRDTDIPERIQLMEEVTGPPPVEDDISIEEETAWIYNQLTSGGILSYFSQQRAVRGIDKEDIGNVLTMLHVHKFDIPFIAMYRKELCLSLFKDPDDPAVDLLGDLDDIKQIPRLHWHKLLWAIQTLDTKWLLIQKRKNALHSYYTKRFGEEARRIDDETRLSLNRQVFESIVDALKDAKSEREIDDVDMKFNLHFPPGEVDFEEGQFKRPKRKSLYNICHKAGLWEVANKFGRSSEQFGAAFECMRAPDELDDAKETPEEVASDFTCAMFEKADDVLKGARHMASVEISCEPNVRKHVRTTFMENAVVSTIPTIEGNTIIDEFHQFYEVKWLKDKPLSSFENAQWLLIQKAEEEKLLQVTVKLPGYIQEKLMSDSRDYYLSLNMSRTAKMWNEQRQRILDDSFFNFILPSIEKEARSLLTSRAKSWLLMEYGKQLWKKISVAPYPNKGATSDDELTPRVMACCWGPGKPVTTFVMLDSAGEVLDILQAGSLNVRSQGLNEQRKKNDQQRLLKFMTDHQPNVVCLGATNIQCRPLKDEINEIIFKILEDHPREVGSDFELVPVFGDESLPRVYENSRVSSDQLPGQQGIVRRAVALGRYLQNPLAMVATLCGIEREILSWKLCHLENFLAADEKYEMIEQVMVDATNQIGIDLNMACSHEWLFAPLQFISGLGPRKAAALQRAFVRAGSVFSRKEITMGIIRKKVFFNAAGFLRVRRSGAASTSSHVMDLLDDTRIHPESYELAKEMAKDVYTHDDTEDPVEMDDEIQEMVIEHVRENPQLLERLVIEEYRKNIEKKNNSRKRETLCDIKRELLHGFQDWRSSYSEPDADEVFQMISGETDETISEGKIVQVSVRFVQEQRVICAFDSGLKGSIYISDFADQRLESSELQEMVQEGDILTCKIKSVEKNRCLVHLTHRDSELKKKYIPSNLDSHFEEGHASVRNEKDLARKEKEMAKKNFKPRMIVHPRFQNWTAEEAMEFLSDKEIGESIFRPSVRGPSYLTLTIKVYDGLFTHKDIAESDKDHKDITSLLRLGKKLRIGDDTFEDLDELMDRYVDPLVSHLKNMYGYRKFRKGNQAAVEDVLKVEKAEYPMRIVYCFSIADKHPGCFVLTYIRSTRPHHHYVVVYPTGFRFQQKNFEDIDRLVSYFQRHIDDKPTSNMNMKSLAAVVPIRSPAPSGGDSVDGGWGGGGWGGLSDSDAERSTPGSRTSARVDHRNNGNGREGHPSGLPRPYGRGRGRGRGHGSNEGQDLGYGSPKWGSGSKDNDDGLSSFPGAKIQNSPGKERFPGSWGGRGGGGTGGGGGGGSGTGSWGGGSGTGNDGWGGGGNRGGGDGGGGGGSTGSWGGNREGSSWVGAGSGGSGSGGDWAGSGGARGSGRGSSGDEKKW